MGEESDTDSGDVGDDSKCGNSEPAISATKATASSTAFNVQEEGSEAEPDSFNSSYAQIMLY